jgi:hypothetical protein
MYFSWGNGYFALTTGDHFKKKAGRLDIIVQDFCRGQRFFSGR